MSFFNALTLTEFDKNSSIPDLGLLCDFKPAVERPSFQMQKDDFFCSRPNSFE